jgi:hypothetical protein
VIGTFKGYIMKDKIPATIDSITGAIDTVPTPARYRCKLRTTADCQKQVARIFREARGGHIDIHEATKLTWILSSLATIIKTSEFELRLEAIEQASNQ